MIDEQGNYVASAQPTTTVVAPPTAETVYSADNISSAVATPAKPLDLSNTTSIYDYYLKGEDVTKPQATYQSDIAALAKAKATAQSRQLAIEQNGLEGMGYIVGAQSRAGQLDSASISALADAAGVSESAYLAAKETATQKANLAISQHDQLTQLIVNNPGAKIKYTDTVESAAKKIEKYTKESEKDAYKKELKTLAMQLGIKTSGTRKELEKRIAKSYKSDKAAKDALSAIELQIKQKSLAGGDSSKITNYNETQQRQLANELYNEAVSKGLYGNYTYDYIKNEGMNIGLDTSTGSAFDNQIRAKFGLESQSKSKD